MTNKIIIINLSTMNHKEPYEGHTNIIGEGLCILSKYVVIL